MASVNSNLWNVVKGIREAEGWRAAGTNSPDDPGSRSWRNHNPGNVRSSALAAAIVDGFATFYDDMTGYFAAMALLKEYADGKIGGVEPTDTIAHALSVWTALDQGSPELNAYCDTVQRVSGVPVINQVGTLLS